MGTYKNIDSDFDSFLDAEGTQAEVGATAAKRILSAFQMQREMEKPCLTKTEMTAKTPRARIGVASPREDLC